MTAALSELSPSMKARIAGVLYLVIIAGGLFAEVYVRGQLIVYGDAAASAANILAHELLFRLGFAVHLFYLLCAVPIAVIFYGLFKRVSAGLALLMFSFNIVAIAIEGTNLLNHLAAVRLLGAEGFGAFNPGQLQALAYAFLRLFASGFGISLTFFGCFCLVIGYLIFRSGFLPRILGVLMAVAGASYLVNSFTVFVVPSFGSLLFPWILLPALVAELSLALWLTIKGVDERKFARLPT